MKDEHLAMVASFDQMTEWYKLLATFLADIETVLIDSGLDAGTVSVLVAQQHKRLLEYT